MSPRARLGYMMGPGHAPFPTPRNLPFHPASGSQTSIRMLESGVGFNSAATRQNAGSVDAFAEPGNGTLTSAALKAPAATVSAEVICALGSASLVSESQGVCAA